MNSGIGGSSRPGESLEQLFGSVFDLAGRFAAQIGQDDIEARLRRTLHDAQRPPAAPPAAPPPAVQPTAGGDREAWDQIIDRYAPLVHAICRGYRLADHDAQDVARQVWRLLAERIAAVREPAALHGWLTMTTRRECLRVLRMAQQAGQPNMLAECPASLTVEASVAAEIRNAGQNAAIGAAFADLPPRCQQLIAMLISDPPHSYAEISDALSIPAGAIGPTLARCLNRLRKAITAPPEDGPHPH